MLSSTAEDGEIEVRISVSEVIYSSPTASLVLTDSSQLTSDSQHLEFCPDAILDFFTTLKRTTYIGFQLPSRDLEEMSGSDIPGYTQRLVCCGQGTSHSPALLPHTDYQRYKDLVVDKGGQPNRGRTTKNSGLRERQIVDIILENVSPLTRQQFVFTSKPYTVQELFYLASTIENTMLSEKEYLVARAPAATIRSRGIAPGLLALGTVRPEISRALDVAFSGGYDTYRESVEQETDFPFDIILGNDFMFDTRVKLDLGRLGISFSFEPSVFIPFCVWDNPRVLFSIVEECEAMDRLVGRFPDVITDIQEKCDILPYDIVAQDHIPDIDILSVAFNVAFHESVILLLANWDIDPLLNDAGNCSDEEKCELTFKNLQKYQKKVASTYNRRRIPVMFKEGDRVVCKCFALSSAADRSSAKLAYK
uniref:Uncharacterized protein n=1 Tax=Timema shepardi TaxID=629360 RepID=A0A7R9AWX0_TIMSH|nr:unnamed protein product [Timema shepardi]